MTREIGKCSIVKCRMAYPSAPSCASPTNYEPIYQSPWAPNRPMPTSHIALCLEQNNVPTSELGRHAQFPSTSGRMTVLLEQIIQHQASRARCLCFPNASLVLCILNCRNTTDITTGTLQTCSVIQDLLQTLSSNLADTDCCCSSLL